MSFFYPFAWFYFSLFRKLIYIWFFASFFLFLIIPRSAFHVFVSFYFIDFHSNFSTFFSAFFRYFTLNFSYWIFYVEYTMYVFCVPNFFVKWFLSNFHSEYFSSSQEVYWLVLIFFLNYSEQQSREKETTETERELVML